MNKNNNPVDNFIDFYDKLTGKKKSSFVDEIFNQSSNNKHKFHEKYDIDEFDSPEDFAEEYIDDFDDEDEAMDEYEDESY